MRHGSDTTEIQAEFKQKCTKPNGVENRPKTLFKAKWTAKPVFRCPFGSLRLYSACIITRDRCRSGWGSVSGSYLHIYIYIYIAVLEVVVVVVVVPGLSMYQSW